MSSNILDDICLYGLTTKITVILLAKAKGDALCRGSPPAWQITACRFGQVDFILRRVCAGLQDGNSAGLNTFWDPPANLFRRIPVDRPYKIVV